MRIKTDITGVKTAVVYLTMPGGRIRTANASRTMSGKLCFTAAANHKPIKDKNGVEFNYRTEKAKRIVETGIFGDKRGIIMAARCKYIEKMPKEAKDD